MGGGGGRRDWHAKSAGTMFFIKSQASSRFRLEKCLMPAVAMGTALISCIAEHCGLHLLAHVLTESLFSAGCVLVGRSTENRQNGLSYGALNEGWRGQDGLSDGEGTTENGRAREVDSSGQGEGHQF